MNSKGDDRTIVMNAIETQGINHKNKEQKILYNQLKQKYKKEILKHNSKTQHQLKKEYIKQNKRFPPYIKLKKEVLLIIYENIIYLSHQFGPKEDVIVVDGKAKDKMYNRINDFYNSEINKRELTEDEMEAIRFYTGRQFKKFNMWKREGASYLNALDLTYKEIQNRLKYYKKQEKVLKGLSVELQDNFVLYRGQTHKPRCMAKGQISSWDSFTSTSCGIGPALGYSGKKYIYEIYAKKSTDVVSFLQNGQNNKEIEMLLICGQEFIVNETRKLKININDAITIITVTLL